jgi:hypothetical protein
LARRPFGRSAGVKNVGRHRITRNARRYDTSLTSKDSGHGVRVRFDLRQLAALDRAHTLE